MKRIISILSLLLLVIIPLQVNALSVSKNNLTIEKGKKETVELYAEVDVEVTQIDFTLVYSSYDVPGYFNVASGLTDNLTGVKHQISFSEPVSGKINLGTISINVTNNPKVTAGTINIHSASAVSTNNETVSLNSQTITASIKKVENTETQPTINNNVDNEDTPIDKDEQVTNLLEKIESEIVNIELKKDVYEYKVYVEGELESLDLKPITKDEDYKLEITTQKIAELKDNKIIITVKDGDYTEEYKITVSKISEQEKIEIDESEFKPTYSYKSKWIVLIALLSITLVVGIFFIKKK